MNIAILPARKGSKRIPNKNIKLFFGLPIIKYPIISAIKSNIFDHIFINTDYENLKFLNKFKEVKVHIRPKYLCNDKATITDVVKDQVSKMKIDSNKLSKINVCLIYATACMLKSNDLKKSLNLFKRSKTKFVLSVNKNDKINSQSFIKKDNYIVNPKRISLSKDYYQDSGYFCWANAKTWISGKNCFNSKTVPYVLKSNECHDINTNKDWVEAKSKFIKLRLNV